MADWKVSREKLKLFTHPNADSLEVARVGDFSLVVQKGIYSDGDTVVFVPRRSILPDDLAEPFRDYLGGAEKNRVREVRLRGELSQGVVLKEDYLGVYDIQDVPLGEDISDRLGIKEYIVPIPPSLRGSVYTIHGVRLNYFDVDNYRIFSDELVEGEEVIVTAKLHGSQLPSFYINGEFHLSSKGLLKQGLGIKADDVNTYWKAVRNVELVERLDSLGEVGTYNVVGEAIPVQKGYSYGLTEPTMKVFEVRVDGVPLPYDDVPPVLQELWVPILYRGAFSEEKCVELSKGMETLSGKSLHIREGVCVRPVLPRKNSKGNQLILKFINPKYKSDGEEIN